MERKRRRKRSMRLNPPSSDNATHDAANEGPTQQGEKLELHPGSFLIMPPIAQDHGHDVEELVDKQDAVLHWSPPPTQRKKSKKGRTTKEKDAKSSLTSSISEKRVKSKRQRPVLPSPSVIDTVDADTAFAIRLQQQEDLKMRALSKTDELLARELARQEEEEEEMGMGAPDPDYPQNMAAQFFPGLNFSPQYDRRYRHGGGRGRGRGRGWNSRNPLHALMGGRFSAGANPQMMQLMMSDRDFDAEDYELLQQLDDGGSRNQGMDNGVLMALPTFKYESNTSSEENSCSICLCEYVEGEELRRLPCLHCYHIACIDKWLKTSSKCPICQWEAADV